MLPPIPRNYQNYFRVYLLINQGSGTSVLFDIALQGESDGHTSYHQHLGSPLKLEVKLKPTINHDRSTSAHQGTSLSNNPTDSTPTITCYSPNWVTFIPDIVIDAKQGLMWRIQLKLDASLCKRQLHSNEKHCKDVRCSIYKNRH